VHPAIDAVKRLEQTGCYINQDYLDFTIRRLNQKLMELKPQLQRWGSFNPDSPKSTIEFLYGRLGLAPAKFSRTTKLPSTDDEALEALEGQHEIIEHMREYRRIQTLYSRYALGLLPYIRSDGRIHPTLNIDGAKTGRMSCEDPAFHSIPSDEEDKEAIMVRRCIAAPDDYVIVKIDEGQLEYRAATWYARDQEMLSIFLQGYDFHKGTARLIARDRWGIDPDDVTKDHRKEAKQFNFGLMYGMQDFEVARRLSVRAKPGQEKQEVTEQQAAALRATIMGKFKGLARFINLCHRNVIKTGLTWTLDWERQQFRRQNLWMAGSHDERDRRGAQRRAFNTPVQGFSSDIVLHMLCRLWQMIDDNEIDAKMFLSIHDALFAYVRKSYLEEYIHHATEIMTDPMYLQEVPLAIDIEVGDSWGDLKPWKIYQQERLAA
jgi:DNA polymerase-1